VHTVLRAELSHVPSVALSPAPDEADKRAGSP
jgi:hypothetical protein